MGPFGYGEILLIIIALLVFIGPSRLPEALENVRRWIRQARDMANQAKGELREQVGDDIADLDWRKWDPRQYNPRRIVREALLEDLDPVTDLKGDLEGLRGDARAAVGLGESGRGGATALGAAGGGAAALGAGAAAASSRPERAAVPAGAPAAAGGALAGTEPARVWGMAQRYDPLVATPYDPDAT
ncbi:twin arginine-targeting protein translocase TatB [Kytococcus aerolatus]|uniref:Twin arginine-targeting protein translocase TatB n=1 Tax=Kytococcus aerolatus TaxID=592308 RepID=A0A212T876_9MICO|nr:hypothetical protein [Kytococcus aerolatus]SNC62041.1 twin arginine-targeting protein translocase TatB [Kytococcus aerolatus]